MSLLASRLATPFFSSTRTCTVQYFFKNLICFVNMISRRIQNQTRLIYISKCYLTFYYSKHLIYNIEAPYVCWIVLSIYIMLPTRDKNKPTPFHSENN